MLGLSSSGVEAVLTRSMPAGNGIAGVLAYVMSDLAQYGDGYEPAVAAQLATTALDLIGTAARLAGPESGATPDSVRDRIRRAEIYMHMRQRLADPALTVQSVAAAHGISVRHLDRILNADGVSPASWIRRQRLDQCRRDLLDPTQRSTPVAVIGGRWGFPDPVVFNRTFQREYGLPPGEYRRRFMLAGQPSE
jgi:transcriptional regulator GlxA family with amidase domain